MHNNKLYLHFEHIKILTIEINLITAYDYYYAIIKFCRSNDWCLLIFLTKISNLSSSLYLSNYQQIKKLKKRRSFYCWLSKGKEEKKEEEEVSLLLMNRSSTTVQHQQRKPITLKQLRGNKCITNHSQVLSILWIRWWHFNVV